ncbi:M24 family metallopeptidase [Azospirillum canadense]|uniref:M24 family metallopeptidase n=1 Tax=Azospirillum canadense TaxID=403962 RepID=UPI002226A2C1|nr:Xaa-Pro peptidase family protein [Azospirillum canadense]MCW2240087.1 Xaa-Pro dipeptidase [Azospirillum canadense]
MPRPNAEPTSLLFTTAEYESRLTAVRAQMQARGVDVLLVDQTEFLSYLTGFGPSETMHRACLVPLSGEPVMVLRAIDVAPFQEHTWLTRHVAFADWEDPVAVLADTLRRNGWAGVRLGLDEDSYCMTVRRFRALQAALPDARFVDFSGVLDVLRARKSVTEIAYIRKAASIADLAMAEAIAVAGEGKSERDAAAAASHAFVRLGADTGRAGPITAGTGLGFLHGHLHSRAMSAGEILHLELIPTVNGYGARLMRPAVIGAPTDEQRHTAETLIHIQDQQFAAMRPGTLAREVDAIAREGILGAGLRDSYSNVTGYTLGHYPPSTPRTSDFTRVFLPTSDWVLETGMTFHMYVSAWGIAFSETILVTDHGAERLTQTARCLFVA